MSYDPTFFDADYGRHVKSEYEKGPKMTIYLASRFRNKATVRNAGRVLNVSGHCCLHSWTEEEVSCLPAEAAARDLQEIDQATAIVVFTEDCDLVPGGMHFEAGYALGRGKKVFVVGPATHIFYQLPLVSRFETLDALLANLK